MLVKLDRHFPSFRGENSKKHLGLATTQLLPRPRPPKNPFKSMRVAGIQPISESLHQLIALDKNGRKFRVTFLSLKELCCNSGSLMLICWFCCVVFV